MRALCDQQPVPRQRQALHTLLQPVCGVLARSVALQMPAAAPTVAGVCALQPSRTRSARFSLRCVYSASPGGAFRSEHHV